MYIQYILYTLYIDIFVCVCIRRCPSEDEMSLSSKIKVLVFIKKKGCDLQTCLCEEQFSVHYCFSCGCNNFTAADVFPFFYNFVDFLNLFLFFN